MLLRILHSWLVRFFPMLDKQRHWCTVNACSSQQWNQTLCELLRFVLATLTCPRPWDVDQLFVLMTHISLSASPRAFSAGSLVPAFTSKVWSCVCFFHFSFSAVKNIHNRFTVKKTAHGYNHERLEQHGLRAASSAAVRLPSARNILHAPRATTTASKSALRKQFSGKPASQIPGWAFHGRALRVSGSSRSRGHIGLICLPSC